MIPFFSSTAFSRSEELVFAFLFVGALRTLVLPVIRSMLSKVSTPWGNINYLQRFYKSMSCIKIFIFKTGEHEVFLASHSLGLSFPLSFSLWLSSDNILSGHTLVWLFSCKYSNSKCYIIFLVVRRFNLVRKAICQMHFGNEAFMRVSRIDTSSPWSRTAKM